MFYRRMQKHQGTIQRRIDLLVGGIVVGAVALGLTASICCGVAFEEQFVTKPRRESPPSSDKKGSTGTDLNGTRTVEKPVPAVNSSGTAEVSPEVASTTSANLKSSSDADESGADWILDLKGSAVSLVILKATGEHEVEFRDFSATLHMTNSVPKKMSISVKTASLDTAIVAFREHLKSAIFLDVTRFPEAKFVTTEIRSIGSSSSYRVRGNLELRGKENEIQFLARVEQTAKDFSGTARVKLDAKHFGIDYPELANELVQEIYLSLKLKFSRALAQATFRHRPELMRE